MSWLGSWLGLLLAPDLSNNPTHRSAPGSRCCRYSAAATAVSSRSSSTTAIRPISSCLRSQAKTPSAPSKTPLVGSPFGSLTSSCPETSHRQGDLKDVDHKFAVVHEPLVTREGRWGEGSEQAEAGARWWMDLQEIVLSGSQGRVGSRFGSTFRPPPLEHPSASPCLSYTDHA